MRTQEAMAALTGGNTVDTRTFSAADAPGGTDGAPTGGKATTTARGPMRKVGNG